MNSKGTLIFDFDGVIADSAILMFQILRDISSKYGFKRIGDHEMEKYRGMDTQKLIDELGIRHEQVPDILKEIREKLSRNIDDVIPVRGMEEIIRQLKDRGFQLGIVTSNQKKNVDLLLNKFGMTGFEFIYPEANIYGKADLLKKAISKQGVPLDSTVFIGDETRDVEAGKTAGVKTAAVTWGLNSKEALSAFNPDWLIDEPEELLDIFS